MPAVLWVEAEVVLVAVPVGVVHVGGSIVSAIATVGVLVALEGASGTDFTCFGCIGGVKL